MGSLSYSSKMAINLQPDSRSNTSSWPGQGNSSVKGTCHSCSTHHWQQAADKGNRPSRDLQSSLPCATVNHPTDIFLHFRFSRRDAFHNEFCPYGLEGRRSCLCKVIDGHRHAKFPFADPAAHAHSTQAPRGCQEKCQHIPRQSRSWGSSMKGTAVSCWKIWPRLCLETYLIPTVRKHKVPAFCKEVILTICTERDQYPDLNPIWNEPLNHLPLAKHYKGGIAI